MKYRVVRSPGHKCWHIQWRNGIFFGTKKKYAGGGEYGAPWFPTEYFPTKELAEARIKLLQEIDEDRGEVGEWIT